MRSSSGVRGNPKSKFYHELPLAVADLEDPDDLSDVSVFDDLVELEALAFFDSSTSFFAVSFPPLPFRA